MNPPIGLTLEQQFKLRTVESEVEQMSLEQTRDYLVQLYSLMMRRETMYKHFLAKEWGINNG